METPKIDTFNDFMEWVESINPNLESEMYLFRGLSNKGYLMEASAFEVMQNRVLVSITMRSRIT